MVILILKQYIYVFQTFVNVVKYKLDLMRKRMETEERDATSRASFKCPSCCKTFTDLEVIHFTKLIQFLLNVDEILCSTAVLLCVGKKKADSQGSGLLGCDVFIFSAFRG